MVATNLSYSTKESLNVPKMDQSVFAALMTHIRKAPLTADKFYLLQKATRSMFFSPAQCLDIVRCFSHSEDKAAIMDLIEKRLCTKVELKLATLLVKSAALSKDRLKILRTLLKHLEELSRDDAKLFVASCFDSERDREAAWAVLAERFDFTPADIEMTDEPTEPVDTLRNMTPVMIFQYIENLAKSNVHPISAFDLPLLDELSLLRKTIIERRQAIADEVEKRHRDGHHFVLPSRISAITRNLKPGRIAAIADPGPKPDRTCTTDHASSQSGADTDISADASPTENGEFYAVTVAKRVNSDSANKHSNQDASSRIWNIVNPAHSSPLSAYYINKNVGVVR